MKTPVDLLLHAKWIIPCEDSIGVLENHALAIQGGQLRAVLPSKEAAKQFIPIKEAFYLTHALLPGLINSHTHIGMSFFRGFADDLSLMDWLTKYIWPAEQRWVDHRFVQDAALLAMAEMIRSGTTCFNDSYFFMETVAATAELVGMRANIGMLIMNIPTKWGKTTEEYFEKALAFYHRYQQHSLITPMLAPHSVYTLDTPALLTVKALSEKYRLKIHIHLHESAAEITESLARYRMRPLHYLHQLGMLSPDLLAVHMTQLDESDFAILEATKPQIIHCPESNMKLANGSCPVHRLLQAGINIAIGTDSVASNNDLDLFGEMRTTALLGKLIANDPTALSAETTLKMATIQGARALGLAEKIGSLRPGKAADIIAVDLASIEMQPLYHPISQIIYAAARHQVTDVWVAGKQLLKDRQLKTLDETALLSTVTHWQQKIADGQKGLLA